MSVEELRARVLKAQDPLSDHAIHVWRAALVTITPPAGDMITLLSADERERSEKFRFPEHRQAFIASHALLRMILAGYCHCEPQDLRFATGDQGKPVIDAAQSRLSQTVSFNLSHSTRVLSLAVAAEGAVGIDVEDAGRDFDLDGLVAECLTDEEAQTLNQIDSAQRRKAFLRYWVHKEAFLKCVGTGFSVPPKDVHVRFHDAGFSEMRCSHPLANVALYGRDLETEPEHLAAVATVERDSVLQHIALYTPSIAKARIPPLRGDRRSPRRAPGSEPST